MDFELSARCREMRADLLAFMDEFVYPNEETFEEQLNTQGTRWQTPQIMEDLKVEARKRGLWNLFLPDAHHGAGLTNAEYAPLCEIMGRVDWAPEVFNCNAPDTGNMEVLHMYGTPAQQEAWLTPLLNGEIRSAFAMTEPDVASSDATNVECAITHDGDEYVINGRKWWISNAGNPRCQIMIVMGKTDSTAARHAQQSQILVPRETPGVTVERMLNVMGYDDAPHGHAHVLEGDFGVPVGRVVVAVHGQRAHYLEAWCGHREEDHRLLHVPRCCGVCLAHENAKAAPACRYGGTHTQNQRYTGVKTSSRLN